MSLVITHFCSPNRQCFSAPQLGLRAAPMCDQRNLLWRMVAAEVGRNSPTKNVQSMLNCHVP